MQRKLIFHIKNVLHLDYKLAINAVTIFTIQYLVGISQ